VLQIDVLVTLRGGPADAVSTVLQVHNFETLALESGLYAAQTQPRSTVSPAARGNCHRADPPSAVGLD